MLNPGYTMPLEFTSTRSTVESFGSVSSPKPYIMTRTERQQAKRKTLSTQPLPRSRTWKLLTKANDAPLL